MRPKYFTYIVVTLVTVLGWSQAARAAEVAPLVPLLDPAKAPELVIRFQTSLADGLKAGGLKVMDPATVRAKLKLPAENAGCAEGSCLGMATAALGPRQLATASIKTVGKNYEITVRIFSAERKETGRARGRCDICTLSEALRATKRVATEVGSKAEMPPAALPVIPAPTKPKVAPTPAVKPEAGNAETGKTETGKTETETEAGAGTGEGATTTTLDTGEEDKPGRVWPLWPALASLGVGVVGLGVGIPLLAMDGDATNCIGDPLPDNRNCADLYDTGAGGWVMTGVGIVALATSGVFFYLHITKGGGKETSQPTQVSLVPVSGGMVLGAHGSF